MNERNIGWIIGGAVFACVGLYLLAWKFTCVPAEHLRNIIFLVGGITAGTIAAWRAWVADKQTKINDLGQITERFTRAVEQLGDDNAYMRMGAIQALRLIGNDNESHVLAVLHLLASFVREKSPAKKIGDVGYSIPHQERIIPRNEEDEITPLVTEIFDSIPGARRVDHASGDIQESIVAIGKIVRKHERFLMEAGIYADLSQSDMACLRRIMECNFSCCLFVRSDIRCALFSHCDFKMAFFTFAELYGVVFSNCDCSTASFDHAHLNYAAFPDTDIEMASFESAFCNGTDFSTAKNLTTEMLKDIIYDAETPPKVPESVTLPPPREQQSDAP